MEENNNVVVNQDRERTSSFDASGGERKRNFKERRPFNKEEGGGKYRAFGFKKKKCRFCGKEKKELDKELNYKNMELIQKFVTDRGKILPGRVTGTCFLHQKRVQLQVKRARYMALLPFSKVEKIVK